MYPSLSVIKIVSKKTNEQYSPREQQALLSLAVLVGQPVDPLADPPAGGWDWAAHNCFNPLSLFELCFPIDWRLLVDWDISNIGLLENSFFSD